MAPMAPSSSALVVSNPEGTPPPRTAEEDAELPVDLTQLPPIPVAKSLLLVNNFVANTTRFLNHFAHECEERITRVSTDLTRVEILLAILEAKLNSIPDLSVTDAEVAAAGDGPATPSTAQLDLGIDDQDLPSMDPATNGAPLPPPPPPPESEDGGAMELSVPPPPPPPSSDGIDGTLVVPPPPPSSMGGMEGVDEDDRFDDDDDDQPFAPAVLKLKDDPIYAKYFTMRRLGIPDQVIEHKLLMDGMDAGILDMDPEGPSPSGGLAPSHDADESTGPMLPIMPPPPPRPNSDSDSDSSDEFDDDHPGLPPPPPSLSAPSESDRRPSGNIGMPFPPPPPPISPTSSVGGPDSLFGGGLPPPPGPPSSTFSHPARLASEDSSSDDDVEEFDADAPRPAADSGVMKLKDDPAFEKYFKMRKLGMPDGVIDHKLKMDGVTVDILNMDPEGPSPNATGAVAAPVAPAGDTAQPPLPPGLPPPPPARPAGGLPPPPIKKYDDSDSDFDSD